MQLDYNRDTNQLAWEIIQRRFLSLSSWTSSQMPLQPRRKNHLNTNWAQVIWSNWWTWNPKKFFRNPQLVRLYASILEPYIFTYFRHGIISVPSWNPTRHFEGATVSLMLVLAEVEPYISIFNPQTYGLAGLATFSSVLWWFPAMTRRSTARAFHSLRSSRENLRPSAEISIVAFHVQLLKTFPRDWISSDINNWISSDINRQLTVRYFQILTVHQILIPVLWSQLCQVILSRSSSCTPHPVPCIEG